MQVHNQQPRGGGRGRGSGRGRGGASSGRGNHFNQQGQVYGAPPGALPMGGPAAQFPNQQMGFQQPGAVPYGAHGQYANPTMYPQQQHPGGYANGQYGQHGQKKGAKIAKHIRFDPSMLVDVKASLQPGEQPALLSSFSLSSLPPQNPGEPPRVSIYTGDASGVMREFSFTNQWVQTRRAQNEGPVTALLAVDGFLFVGVQQMTPNQASVGLVKGYHLTNNAEYVLHDPRLGPAAHNIAVKAITQAGQFLITGGSDGQVKAWSLSDNVWALRGCFGNDAGAHAAEITAISGKCTNSLVTASMAGDLRIWNLLDGSISGDARQAHTGPVAAIDVVEQQFIVTSGSMDDCICVWGAPSLVPVYRMSLAPTPIPGVQSKPHIPITAMKMIHANGAHQLLVGYRNGTAAVFHMRDKDSFDKLGFIDGHQRQTRVLAFDIVPTNGSQMLCLATDKGFVNWFQVTA